MVPSATTVTIDLGSQASLDKLGESQIPISDNVVTSPEDEKKKTEEKNGKLDVDFIKVLLVETVTSYPTVYVNEVFAVYIMRSWVTSQPK